MTKARLPFGGSTPGAGTPLQRARGLAELAFRSSSHAGSISGGRHLALLQADSLELDLSDPAQRCFDDYELLELLGEGGMGVVYRARQVSLDREVAIKLLSAGPWASRDFIARFEREAQNAARMQHPNIVAIHEVGSFEGLQFFSMQLVRGESLSAKLRRGESFTPRAAADLMRTVAEAVGYAHALRVLHLDLKPGNLLLDQSGTPYVADFGLARRLGNALAADNDEVSGTPAYMAPEQAEVRAHKLTAATDIWGLGAILYELLTGHPPFRAGNAHDTLKLVLQGKVRSPRRWRPSLPLDLQAIVMRCLNRDPAARYPTARALADDLARFVDGRPVQARPLNGAQRILRWTLREPKLAATTLLAFVLLAGGLAATTTQWRRADANAQVARTNARTASERLWASRDDAALRYMESAEGWKAAPLLLVNLSEMEAQGARDRVAGVRKRLGILENANPKLIDVLPTPEYTNVLAFSPDGRKLAATPGRLDLRLFDLASGKQSWRTGVDGHSPRVESIDTNYMEFDTRGRSILVTDEPFRPLPFPLGMFMHRVDASSGKWLPIPPVTDSGPYLRLGYSPDGGHALTLQSAREVQWWGGEPWHEIASGPKFPGIEYACAVLFAPDLRSFACRGPGPEKTWLVSTATLRPQWEIDPEGFGSQMAWAFSPDSRWLALGDADGVVIVANTATHEIRRLSPRPSVGVRELAFSSDGAWLAAAAGKGGIYLWKWPEGRLVTWPFAAGLEPLRVQLDRRHLRVLASGEHGWAGVWQIPETEFEMDRGDAIPLGGRIATLYSASPDAGGHGDAIAWQPGKDLLAQVAAQRVQVQRLPPAVLKRARAAPIKPTTLRFDGRRLVSVEGRRVRLVGAVGETALGFSVELPQPPGFAELTADGKSLVATAGRVLLVFDVASGKPRFAPVTLADSPQHVELNPDSSSVVTTWLDHDAHGRAEVAEAWDLGDGHRIAGPVRLPGPQQELLFNADGSQLLAWNLAHVTLRDGRTLAEVPGPLADLWLSPDQGLEQGRVCAAAFGARDAPWLSSLQGGVVDGAAPGLRHFGQGASRTIHTGRCLVRMLPLPDGTLVVIPIDSGAKILQANGVLRAMPDLEPDTLRAELAVSADGRWLARARRDGVVLFDAHAGTRIAVLQAALPGPDIVWQLAFSPDGNRLLARSMRNRLMVWDLHPDTRPTREIARELALRDIAPGIAGDKTLLAQPSDAERAALRAADPGPQPAPATVAPGPAVRTLPGGAIPPRGEHTPPELLDLTDHYTFGFGEVTGVGLPGVAGDFSWLPIGVQRFLGIDYDLRGGIQMQAEDGLSGGARGNRPVSFTVATPRPDIAAVDSLLLANPVYTGGTRELLQVTLRYVDGGTVVTHVPAFSSLQWAPVPGDLLLAAFGDDARAYPASRRAEHVYAMRFPNPEPARAVQSITFTAGRNSGVAAVILAVTVEPAGGTAAKH